MGVVAQDTHIFNDTLREEPLLANPEADEASLQRDDKEGQLVELVEGLPGGWTGTSASRASGSPAGSGSGWPSPGPCSRTLRC